MWGHVTDGKQSDSTEHRCHSTLLRQHLPDPGEPLSAADSKSLAGEAMALAAAHRLRGVASVPQAVRLRQAVGAAPEFAGLPLLSNLCPTPLLKSQSM